MKYLLKQHSKSKKLNLISILLFSISLLISQIVIASNSMESDQLVSLQNILLAESEACTSCIRSYGCDRSNKTCQKNCLANLYTDEADRESCSKQCTSNWSKCEMDAKKACSSYYCASEKK